MRPLVSVIIPTFDRGEYLYQAIDSVLKQTYKPIEVIVVDDGSTQDVGSILTEKYGTRIKYFYQKNFGVCHARNTGIIKAKGEFIAFLDDDDLWLPRKIETQVEYLEKHPDVSFVFCGASYINAVGSFIGVRKRWWPDRRLTFTDIFKRNMVISPSAVMIRKSILEDVGLFDPKIKQSGDFDLWLRLAKLKPFVYLKEILFHYRIHQKNMSKNLDERIKDHKTILQKKEIKEHTTWISRKRKLANSCYRNADIYFKSQAYFSALISYTHAILYFPLIGIDYWPKETRKIKFSLPYRIIKPYILIIICLCKKLNFFNKKVIFILTGINYINHVE